MAHDGNSGNNSDPLLQNLITQPENNDVDVTIPMPVTPSLPFNELSQHPSSSASTEHNFGWSKSTPSMAAINNMTYPQEYRTERSVSKFTVTQVVLVVFVVYLSLGVLIYWLNQDSYLGDQTHPLVDALYFCVVTMCTIGYGDITPDSVVTKVFAIVFVLFGFGFIGMLSSRIATYVRNIREDFGFGESIMGLQIGRMMIRLRVGMALGAVLLCLGFGVLIMHFIEEIGWFDSFYLSFMSVTTVGYGNVGFKTLPGRLLAAIWLLVTTLAVARAFLYLAAARVDKSHIERVKRVLNENMSLSQLIDADMDKKGYVSKAEYIIHKLKMMEKISERDIGPVADQFDQIDRTNKGKINFLD